MVATALLALSLIAPPPEVRPDERPDISNVTFLAADSSRALRGRTLVFPRTVLAAEFDSTTRTLFVLLAPRSPEPTLETPVVDATSRPVLIAWDVEQRAGRWAKHTTRTHLDIVGDCLVLRGQSDCEVVDPTSGATIATLDEFPLTLRGSDALITVGKDHVRRFAPRTGAKQWDFPIAGMGRYPEVWILDGDLYVAAHGLAQIDSALGIGWHHLERVVRSQTLSRAIYGILNFDFSRWGWEASNLYAKPLPAGESVFFAADSELIALDRADGSPRWRRTVSFDPRLELRARVMGIPQVIRRTPGIMTLGYQPGSLSVVSMGWAYLNGTPARAEPPGIALLDPHDGRRLSGRMLDSALAIVSYARGPHGHYLISDGNRLRRLDDTLRTVAGFRSTAPIQRLSVGLWRNRVLLASSNELLLLDPVTLTPIWRHLMGGGMEFHNGGTWVSGTSGLLKWSSRGDSPAPRWYPLPLGSARIRGSWAVVRRGRDVHLLRLPPGEAVEALFGTP